MINKTTSHVYLYRYSPWMRALSMKFIIIALILTLHCTWSNGNSYGYIYIIWIKKSSISEGKWISSILILFTPLNNTVLCQCVFSLIILCSRYILSERSLNGTFQTVTMNYDEKYQMKGISSFYVKQRREIGNPSFYLFFYGCGKFRGGGGILSIYLSIYRIRFDGCECTQRKGIDTNTNAD